MPSPDIVELQRLVPQIVAVMRSHPEVENYVGELKPVYWLQNFPRGSCDIASLTIASVLDELDRGDWQLISSFDDAGNGHTWLRFLTDDSVSLSIDATLHQFESWDQPWVGAGDSPAASRFINPRHTFMFLETPDWWPRGHEAEVAAWTRAQFSAGTDS